MVVEPLGIHLPKRCEMRSGPKSPRDAVCMSKLVKGRETPKGVRKNNRKEQNEKSGVEEDEGDRASWRLCQMCVIQGSCQIRWRLKVSCGSTSVTVYLSNSSLEQ